MADRRQLECCDPAAEWCRKYSMEEAIEHAHWRASVSGFRQRVYRSFEHETLSAKYNRRRQFWLIEPTRPAQFVRRRVQEA